MVRVNCHQIQQWCGGKASAAQHLLGQRLIALQSVTEISDLNQSRIMCHRRCANDMSTMRHYEKNIDLNAGLEFWTFCHRRLLSISPDMQVYMVM